jgi:NRAMP (natural resistance-associated macrophage protein)-like metal ion transporter
MATKVPPDAPASDHPGVPVPPAGAREREMRREPNPVKRALKILGPGLITGASDDDPSGIGTYAMAGASLGYATLWTALVTFPLMAAVQFICAKVGLVTGMGVAGVLRRHYPRPLLYAAVAALLVSNTINAGADIGAIAAGINLLVPVPIPTVILPIGLVLLVMQVWGSYRQIARTFKWLTLALFAYIGAAFFARPDWHAVARETFVPEVHFDRTYLTTLVAILGTTISPYLFFWQASQEVEEQRVATGPRVLWRRHGTSNSELRYAAWDVAVGMLFSNVVMYFIILTTAATLHARGLEVGSAEDAARALEPLAGKAAGLFLALGLVGTGFLAVPILTTSGAYALAEAVGWKFGLDKKPGKAKEFYLVIAASTVIGLQINFLGIKPVDALFWTSVINGFLTPPLLVVILLIANNRGIMKERVNGWVLNALGGATAVAMFAAAGGLVWTWLRP